MAERAAVNRYVAGSNPAGGAHQFLKEETVAEFSRVGVGGSNPSKGLLSFVGSNPLRWIIILRSTIG